MHEALKSRLPGLADSLCEAISCLDTAICTSGRYLGEGDEVLANLFRLSPEEASLSNPALEAVWQSLPLVNSSLDAFRQFGLLLDPSDPWSFPQPPWSPPKVEARLPDVRVELGEDLRSAGNAIFSALSLFKDFSVALERVASEDAVSCFKSSGGRLVKAGVLMLNFARPFSIYLLREDGWDVDSVA